jgi:hypothetical protein
MLGDREVLPPVQREPVSAIRRDQLVADVSSRLRNACAHMDDEEFRELVFDIVEMTLRFEERDTGEYAARLDRVVRRTPPAGSPRPPESRA